jgi:DNA-binding response OmpR family regulator
MTSSSILLVDDETSVLSFLSMHLRDQGYSVDVAASRQTAETLLSARQYEVIVVDLALPSARTMDGRELLKVAREQNPEAVRILFSTHVAPRHWPVGCAEDADVIMLSRPTPMHEISHIITQSMRAQL